MEALLNRWRGTGKIIGPLSGNIIYAIYWLLVIGFFSEWYWGLLAGIAYIAGESFSWGKWVGYVSSENREAIDMNICYNSDDGVRFPYIHYMANSIVKEKVDYLNYARIALVFRGVIWFAPFLTVLFFAGLIPLYYIFIGSLSLGISFVVACELGRLWNFELRSRFLNMSVGWENQEIIYGLFHFIFITCAIIFFNF